MFWFWALLHCMASGNYVGGLGFGSLDFGFLRDSLDPRAYWMIYQGWGFKGLGFWG